MSLERCGWTKKLLSGKIEISDELDMRRRGFQ